MELDLEQMGTISVNDLKKALERCGETVNDDQVYWMIAMADPENKGIINFAQFKSIIMEKRENERGMGRKNRRRIRKRETEEERRRQPHTQHNNTSRDRQGPDREPGRPPGRPLPRQRGDQRHQRAVCLRQ